MFLALDHHIIAQLKPLDIKGRALVVAVSGGVDSMILLWTLNKIKPLFQFKIHVVHIHHGNAPQQQLHYRDQAWSFITDLCTKMNLPFDSNLLQDNPKKFLFEASKTPTSERELRNYRYRCLLHFCKKIETQTSASTLLALGHNSNDLVETRLIRLIRGTGPEGISAMELLKDNKLRPLIEVDRDQIEAYAKQEQLSWLEDPSNHSQEAFRNWLRQEWLPQLEAKRPGSMVSLARSLRHLSERRLTEVLPLEDLIRDGGIDMKLFLRINERQKEQVLAHYMKHLDLKDYGLSHIREVLKRLDSRKREHRFSLLRHHWRVNAKQIKASSQEAGSLS